jgi:hypothetical protein
MLAAKAMEKSSAALRVDQINLGIYVYKYI